MECVRVIFLVSCLATLSVIDANGNAADNRVHVHPKLMRTTRSARITGRYLVQMNDEVSFEDMEQFVLDCTDNFAEDDDFSFNVLGRMSIVVGFIADMSEDVLEFVCNDDMVESVEEDQYTEEDGIAFPGGIRLTSNWGLDVLDQTLNSLYKPPCELTGKGVDVYVLDSGVNYNHFGDNAVYPGCDIVDQVNGGSPMLGADCSGHGTHIASIINNDFYGIAPDATILSVRVLPCNGKPGSISMLILGLQCVLDQSKARNRSSVVNMSLQGKKSVQLKNVVHKLLEAGIIVVGAAGNNPSRPADSCTKAPAAIPGIITVSASTKDNKAYKGSNAGLCVDLYAPGVDIQGFGLCDTCSIKVGTGSSQATAFVSGAVALLLEKCPNMSPWEVRSFLLTHMVTAKKLDFSDVPDKFKGTTPNLLLHTANVCDAECN